MKGGTKTTQQTTERPPRDPNERHRVATNRRARFEYEIMETLDAGMALVGTEVKSLRAGKLSLQEAFCKIEHDEVWLYNMHVSPYEQGNRFNVEPLRKRKLLLHRKEIIKVKAELEQKGLALIPLSLYFQRGFAKLEIAIARGKKLHDKRDSIAERDRQRETMRQAAERE